MATPSQAGAAARHRKDSIAVAESAAAASQAAQRSQRLVETAGGKLPNPLPDRRRCPEGIDPRHGQQKGHLPGTLIELEELSCFAPRNWFLPLRPRLRQSSPRDLYIQPIHRLQRLEIFTGHDGGDDFSVSADRNPRTVLLELLRGAG